DGTAPDPAFSTAPYRIYNIGNSDPVKLLDFVDAIENRLGIKAIREYLPMQPGDVPMTFSDVTSLREEFGYSPGTPVEKGIDAFIGWYMDYFHIKK
ncbi:MAG: NAD-dependent epimerase, partial [Bacteroidales bacterium]